MMSNRNSIMSDDEDSDIEQSWRSQRFGGNRRNINKIIDESDDDESSSAEDDQLENLEKSGRFTPSIQKAIRRSMFNISMHQSDEDASENEDDDSIIEKSIDESHHLPQENGAKLQNTIGSTSKSFNDLHVNSINDKSQYSDYDSEEAEDQVKHKGNESANSTRSILDSSYENPNEADLLQDSDQQIIENHDRKHTDVIEESTNNYSNLLEDSNSISDKSVHDASYQYNKASAKNSTNISLVDSDVEIINETNLRQSKSNSILSSSAEISNTDSASGSSSVNEEEHPEVILMAKEELKGADVNLKTAQERAYLVCKLNKIGNDLEKMKHIAADKRTVMNLPDQGQKLFQSIEAYKVERDQLKAKLEKIQQGEKSFINSPRTSLLQLKQKIMKQETPNYFTPSSPEYINDNDSDIKSGVQNLHKPTMDHNPDSLGKKALKTFETQQALTVDRLHDLHGSLTTRPAEDEEAPDPRGLKVKLLPHQKHALAWIFWREQQKPAGGMLADDMGLGKTLTMISLVMATKKDDHSDEDDEDGEWIRRNRSAKYSGGTLVVCPASLIAQWAAEVKTHCRSGELIVETYHGYNRTSSARTLARNDIVITTYQLLAREFKSSGNNGKMFSIQWKRVILDEAHVIRNHKSQTCEAVCGLHARKRWALTGTPIHNKELDLYSILKFLRCSPFDDLRVWKRWVDNKNAAGHERLATVMKSLMLRRTKQELIMKGQLDTLPEKALEVINIDLDPDERVIYEKLLIYSQKLFAQFLAQRAEKEHMFELGAGKYNKPYMDYNTTTKFNKAQKELLRQHGEVKSHTILALILRLRQLCCHPSLIHSMLDRDDIEQNGLENETAQEDILSKMNRMKIGDTSVGDDDDGDIGVDERVRENLLTSDNPVFKKNRPSSKLRVILSLVEEILAKKEKTIIVSQWTSNLDILANHLNHIQGATYKMFTGAVAIKNRQQIVDEFNKHREDPQILLLSLTAGGVGLNLVGANHLMLIDIHWNPQLESQAQDRIYRFGQKKNVFIYKFICNGTIEERIKNLQEHKLSLATNVLGGSGKVSSKLTLDDLRSLFNM